MLLGLHSLNGIASDDILKFQNLAYKNSLMNLNNGEHFLLACSPLNSFEDCFQYNGNFYIGRLYNRNNERITSKHINLLPNSSQTLIKNYWGDYIAILKDDIFKNITIINSPGGQSTLFYMALPENTILFASSIDLIYQFLCKKFTYNWPYLIRYLMKGDFATTETPFQGVQELLNGTSVQLQDSLKVRSLWNFVNTHKIEPRDYEEVIVDVLSSTTAAWSKDLKKIYADCSGGLDSTSLIYVQTNFRRSTLKKAINIYHPLVASSNELEYARKVASSNQIELIEFDQSQSLPFTPCNYLVTSPNRPSLSLSRLKTEQLIDQYYGEPDVYYMSGEGGDHLFMSPPMLSSATDLILKGNLSLLRNKIRELSAFHNCTYLYIYKNILKNLFFSLMHMQKSHIDLDFLIPNWLIYRKEIELMTVTPHPYLTTLRNCAPGKFCQIDHVLSALHNITVDVRGKKAFYPILLQPTIELGFALDTFHLYDKGYDRYPFRQAISSKYKTDLVWRKDKGETTGVMQRGIAENMEYILDLCLNGHLVKEGIACSSKIETTIRESARGGLAENTWHLNNLITLEIFFHYWNHAIS